MSYDGYLIPNANDALDYKQAEPDAVDFQILGNGAYGVLYGCDYEIPSGNSFRITSINNAVVLDNTISHFTGPISVGLNGGSGDDRFDLVVYNGSELELITGTATSDPEFQPIPDGSVLIAALFVPAGLATNGYTLDHVTDKRVFLTRGARAAALDSEVFLRTNNPDATPKYTVYGSGKTQWGDTNGPAIQADSSTTLEVTGDSITVPDLNAGNTSITGTANVSDRLTAKNLGRGSMAQMNAVTGSGGDLFQNTDTNKLYVWNDGWKEIHDDEYPIGTIITSLLATPPDASWIVLDGTSYQKSEVRLEFWDEVVVPLGWDDDASNFTTPNLRGAFLQNANAGQLGLVSGSNSTQLQESNLPSHQHFGGGSVTTTPAGGHTHTGSSSAAGAHTHTTGGGAHNHPINDPEHRHMGMNPYGRDDVPTYFCGAVWGGNNKLDAHFSDASHTWTVDMAISTISAATGITIPTSGSHTHSIHTAGNHSHSMDLDAVANHTHSLPAEASVGEGVPVDNRPKNIQVNFFCKV